MRRRSLIWLTLLVATTSQWSPAAEPEARTLSWNQLQPVIEFEDPFEKLDPNQLIDLSILARVEDLEKRDDLGVLTERKLREAAEARARLEQQKVDIEGLLSRRGEMNELYQQRASASERSLDGQRIRIPGYLLPLKFTEARVTEFLLVPWVGACIHTPPPPPNQMVHVAVPDGVEHRNRFAPVWIEGEIRMQPDRYALFLVDGSRDIEVAYTMTTDKVTDYSTAESDVLAQVQIPDTIGSEHSWLQRWQVKTALLFTKAMTDIEDRHSSGPLFWGLLVAFGYGVVHTLGPGHGKAVVISYFVGERGSLGRGVRMGTQIALFHVLSAIVVVWLADFAVRQATGQAPSDYRAIRLGSYALIAAIGAFMLWKALLAPTEHSHHDHEHGHRGCCACSALENRRGPSAWLALAVGAVPCTGALLVLLFGMANGLLGPAILLVIAISLGMAVAMSGIGLLAITSRRMLDRRMDHAGSTRFAERARIAGAALILLIGVGLFTLTLFNPLGTTTVNPSSETMAQSPGELPQSTRNLSHPSSMTHRMVAAPAL